MSRSHILKEELELDAIRETEEQLRRREQEYAQIPKKLAQELKERECTMPPLAEIADRRRQIEHDQIVSRGQVSNILRDQGRSFLLLVLLLAATATLIWWGLTLMRG